MAFVLAHNLSDYCKVYGWRYSHSSLTRCGSAEQPLPVAVLCCGFVCAAMPEVVHWACYIHLPLASDATLPNIAWCSHNCCSNIERQPYQGLLTSKVGFPSFGLLS